MAERGSLLEKLAVALRTQTMRFAIEFIAEEGLTLLLDMLVSMDYPARFASGIFNQNYRR